MYSIGRSSAATNRGDSTRSPRDNGALACYHRGSKAITKLGPSFLANLIISLPSTNNGGERRIGWQAVPWTNSSNVLHTISTWDLLIEIHGNELPLRYCP